MPPTPDRDPSIDGAADARSITVLAVMEYPKISASSGKKSGRPAKTEKKKELDFVFEEGRDAYLRLLRALLERHGQSKYRVTARKPFSIQALVPPQKAYVHV